MHDVLRHIQALPVTREEISTLLVKTGVPPEIHQSLTNQIMQVATHPKFVELHTGKYTVYNEREWIDETGASVRPDRVLMGENTCVVIDYKTGSDDPSHG